MALTSTTDVLTALGIFAPTANDTTRYDLLRRSAERAVISYCKWPIEGRVSEIRYYDGVGYKDIVLQPYTSKIQNVWLDPQGNYGSTTGAFASNTLLVSGLDYALVFEGAGAGPAGQVGRSGLLRKLLNNVYWFPSDLIYYRGAGGLAYRWPSFWPAGYGNVKVQANWGFQSGVSVSSAAWSGGTATYTTGAPHGCWSGQEIVISGISPDGYNGNQLQVVGVIDDTNFTVSVATNPGTYVSGGSVDAIPQDVKLAVYTLVGVTRNTVKTGYPLQSEGLPDYNYSLMSSQKPEIGTVRQLLSAYRSTPAAGIAG